MAEKRNAYTVLMEKSVGRRSLRREEKRRLGRPRHKWENNIKMDLKGRGQSCMDWIDLAQDRDQSRTS
jgi:hypothetical protein